MKFFDSEIIQQEMQEIADLQDTIYKNVFTFPDMDDDGKLDHLKILKTLIEKQKILYARLSLSDDPQAKKMKENIMKSAKMMGIPSDTDLNFLFSKMTEMIELMEEQLDRA